MTSTVLSSVSHELQNLFSTFGVVRNDFFEKIFKTVAQKFPKRYKVFFPFDTQTSGGFLLKLSSDIFGNPCYHKI